MNCAPSFVCVNFCPNSTEPNILEKILAHDKKCFVENFEHKKFLLKTKYYEAEIVGRFYDVSTLNNADFSCCEAILLIFDPNDETILAKIQEFFKKNFEGRDSQPSVGILYCERMAPANENMQKWCIENFFELVEENPDEATKHELQDCGEKFALDRVLEILESHVWSSISNSKAHEKFQVDAETALSSSNIKISDADKSLTNKIFSDQNLQENFDENFESLFEKFASMKTVADGLPDKQKKQYAERVATAFWRAMGGDESEIGDLEENL